MKTLDVEILAPGKWSGVVGGTVNITHANLADIVTSFSALKELIDVPLKFGHNKEQKMTDGQPSIGWVDSVWINDAGKLMAKFVNLPTIVANAFKNKLYRNVSIEAIFDVEHKGNKYGTVLTAVALLGADMPAVNTLSDLQTYMSAGDDIQFSSRLELSVKNGSIKIEDNDMTELEKALAEVERLKALNLAQGTAISLAATADVEKDTEIATLKASAKATVEASAKVEFSRREDVVKTDLEALVKAEVITPAKRDELVTKFSVDTADSVELAVGMLKEMKPASKDKDSSVKDKDKNMNEDGQEPDEIVHKRATVLSAKNNISFGAAVDAVLAEDPKLARDYVDQNDQEVA